MTLQTCMHLFLLQNTKKLYKKFLKKNYTMKVSVLETVVLEPSDFYCMNKKIFKNVF